jgi:hypothetical protein
MDRAAPVTWRVVGDIGSIQPDGTFTADPQALLPVRGTLVARLALASGGELATSVAVDVKPAATIAGRRLFYNNSAFDGYDPHAVPGDERAIAPDKRPLLPEEGRATAANYTSYDKGINGLVIEFDGAWTDAMGPDDFEFAVGFGSGPAPGAAAVGWSEAPRPREVAVRPFSVRGRPLLRVWFVWDDGAIRNQWLRVTVLPTDRTGLAAPDVFYFGNLAGDTGDAPPGATVARVTALDVERTLRRRLSVSDLTSSLDHDRDGIVTVADAEVTRRNRSAWIELITGQGTA